MHTSRPIAVQGRFLGVAVTHVPQGPTVPGPRLAWRFIATGPVMDTLDGATFPSAAKAEHVARLVLARHAGPGRRP